MSEKRFDSYSQAFNYYKGLGFKDHGWLNDGVSKPAPVPHTTAYQNQSGSSTLYVNEEFGVMYSVDMGD